MNLDEVIKRLAASCRCRCYAGIAVKGLQFAMRLAILSICQCQSLYDIKCIIFSFLSSSCKSRYR